MSNTPLTHLLLQSRDRQRGVTDFKRLAIIAGGAFALFMIVIVVTAPAPKDDQAAPAPQNTATNGQNTAAQPKTSPAPAPKTATVKLPADFRRFTSKQYDLSVAYPQDWGSPVTEAAPKNQRLQAVTKEVTYPLATATIQGNMSFSIMYPEGLRLPVRPGNPIIAPVRNNNSLEWKVVSVGDNEPQYRVGNTFKDFTVQTVPSGLQVYDFTWLNAEGLRQGRLVYAAKENYVVLTLPPLRSAGGTNPTPAELAFYNQFVRQVMDTISLP